MWLGGKCCSDRIGFVTLRSSIFPKKIFCSVNANYSCRRFYSLPKYTSTSFLQYVIIKLGVPTHRIMTDTDAKLTPIPTTNGEPTVAEILGRPSWEGKANLFTRWTIGYLAPLLRLGASRPLTSLDIGGPLPDDRAASIFDKIKADWDSQTGTPIFKKDKKTGEMVEQPRGIGKGLIRSFGKGKFVFALMLYVASECISIQGRLTPF